MSFPLRREIFLARVLVGVTLAASVLLGLGELGVLRDLLRTGRVWRALEQCAFLSIVYVLTYGSLVYQLARLGYLHRLGRHKPLERSELETVFDGPAPDLAVLVPSYREESGVVQRALLSAALQEYPNRRIVLLIDDPPDPATPEAAASLAAARGLPAAVAALLEKPARRFGDALDSFRQREGRATLDRLDETRHLAELHAEAARWFEDRAAQCSETDHTDRLFAELVLRGPARTNLERSIALEDAAAAGQPLDAAQLRRGHEQLASRFRVEITSFERKRYVNLSHEPNKAMNLNTYLGLLGGSFRAVSRGDGLHLEPAAREDAELHVPDAEYVITLDADSLLAPDYALRLQHILAQPGHERVAVAQTPYSAVPGAPSEIERIAGATTDMQYILHQGFTHYGATYWVGANAMLRRRALADLDSVHDERGFPVHRFIRDHTVIEDTESSVHMAEMGWSLHNHPERLAYSATPPDFGALLVQRRRWANGGLLILPRCLRYLFRRPWRRRTLGEGLMRTHYLASIAGANLGLLLLLAIPFEDPAHKLWIPLTALPYFVVYGRDLVQAGYRAGDLLRVYALNLLLLPVNLGGVFQSLRQAITGKKAPFGRTPKVEYRTAATPLYVVAQYALLGLLALNLGFDLARARWLHAAFLVFNAGMLLYAVVRLMGLRESVEDLRLAWSARGAGGGGGAAPRHGA